jgi:hypothetical protein
LLLQNKFKGFGHGEHVIANYGCSITKIIMLQGMLYITDRNIYFYSPFNNTTIIGYGTKVTIPYLQLNEIKKVDSMLVFKTGIKLNLKSGQDIQFNSIA